MELLESFTDYLENTREIRLGHLLSLELPSGDSMYLTDYLRDITYDGQTYTAGSITSVGSVKQTKTFNIYDLAVKVTGVSNVELERVLNSKLYLNRQVTVYRVYLDIDGEIIPMLPDGSTLKYFEGLISKSSIADTVVIDGAGTSVITWTCSSEFSTFNKVNGRITDTTSHRGLEIVDGELVPSTAAKRYDYQSDLGFEHANTSVGIIAEYQTTETRYKTKTNKNWLGMVTSVKTIEYEAVISAEIELEYDLTTSYLPVVYGVQNIEPNAVFVDSLLNNPNEVYIVYAFCEGEIDGFMDIYINEQPAICWDEFDSESRTCYGLKRLKGNTINGTEPTQHGRTYTIDDGDGAIEFTAYHGGADQPASSILTEIAEGEGFYLQHNPVDGGDPIAAEDYWGTKHQLLDTAYLVVKVTLTEERDEIPSFTADIRGKKVDTFTSDGQRVTGTNTSTNPAWQILDYISTPRFGGSLTVDRIDTASFYNVAQLCATQDTSYEADWVPYWNYVGWDSQDNQYRDVLQCNVALLSEKTVFKNLNLMLDQIGASLNISGGVYTLTLEAEQEPIADINANQIIGGSLTLSDTSVANRYNSIQANILDPGTEWGSNQITFYNSEYKTEDNEIENKGSFTFPYITNYYTARSVAERFLNSSRSSRELTFTLPFLYAYLQINDHITFTNERYSWDSKRFLITELEWTKLAQVKVTAKEYLEGTFINSEQIENTDTTPSVVYNVLPPTSLSYVPYVGTDLQDKNGTLQWLPSKAPLLSYYKVQRSGTTTTSIVEADRSNTTDYVTLPVFDLEPDTYTYSVRAVDISGYTSSPVLLEVEIGLTTALPAVQGFTITNASSSIDGEWLGADLILGWDKPAGVAAYTNVRYNLVLEDLNGEALIDVDVTDLSYTYTLAENKANYATVNGSLGVTRQLTAKIKTIADDNVASADWSYL